MNFRTLLIIMSTFYFFGSQTTIAAPNDLFIKTQDYLTKTPSVQLNLDLSIDAVNDTIDFFDLREKEGITNQSTGDYLGAHISALYQLYPQWQIEGTYWYREIDYAVDTNKIHTILVGARYFPEFIWNNKYQNLALRASLWQNTASNIDKSTPTTVNTRTFNQVKVESPDDLQLQLDAIFSKRIDHMNQLNAFAHVGYSKVNVDQVMIQAQYNGCLMNIDIHQDNRYVGQLARPCSLEPGSELTNLTIRGDANEYGLDIQKDLNYRAYYLGLGGSWNWRYRDFESQIAYQYTYLSRKDIDDRVQNFGSQSIKDNHKIGVKLSYDFHPLATAFVQGEIYQNNFVGDIPFLYNALTAPRLDKRYGLASLGIRLKPF